MDYEKLYKESLERAKIWQEHLYEISDKDYADELNYIFPELKESEEEKIRKELIKEIDGLWENDSATWPSSLEKKNKYITWLEKQREKSADEMIEALRTEYEKGRADAVAEMQKPTWSEEDNFMFYSIIKDFDRLRITDESTSSSHYTECMNWLGSLKQRIEHKSINDTDDGIVEAVKDTSILDKVEPKFKVGDWITDGNITIQIEAIKNDCYLYCGYCALYSIKTADKVYHLWTIQDAKDGDVLCDGTTIFIFKDLLSDGSVMSYCDYDTDSGESDAFCPLSMNLMCSKINPATKEQCDLLFQKMKEAGYEWDVEKKEPKKIHVIDEGKAEMDYCFTKMMNGEKVSSAWNEEDEKAIGIIKIALQHPYDMEGKWDRKFALGWLKSLKERMKGE